MRAELVILTWIFFFYSCKSNQICVDSQSGTISTQDSRIIDEVFIENKNLDVIILKRKEGIKGTTFFSIYNPDTLIFNIQTIYGKQTSFEEFINSEDTILVYNISVPDMARGELQIAFDSTGRVIDSTCPCKMEGQ